MTKRNNLDKNNNVKKSLENQYRSIEELEKTRKQITIENKSKKSIENGIKGISRFESMNIENPLRKNLSGIESMAKTFKQMEKINMTSISAVENAIKGISRFEEMNIENPLRKFNSAIAESTSLLIKIGELNKGLELPQYKNSLLYLSEVLEQSSLESELLYEDSLDISEIENILCDDKLSIQEKIVDIFKRYINKNIIIFMVVYYVIINPLYGVYSDYAKNLITSAIENTMEKNEDLDRNNVNKSIKKEGSKAIAEYSNNYNDEREILNNYRFVNCDSLNVRSNNATKSAVIYSLNRGDVVKIINKQKNWTKVEYKNEDETVIITGWVFTRYISRFN